MRTLSIGTRGSPLALWQANWVRDLLSEQGIEARVEVIRTSGDKHQKGPLAAKGGKGLFVKELEAALLEGAIDLAVHSLKDVPTDLAEPFTLAAFLPRADPRDCFIAREGIEKPGQLPDGAAVGSCSPRRISQILNLKPNIEIQDLRGNVETRLNKIREGVLDATFLAKAGLDRLGISDDPLIHPLSAETMLPAAGQGIVAIEISNRSQDLLEKLKILDDANSRHAAVAERSLVRNLGGTCVSPIGAHATIDGETLHLTACVGDPEGKRILRDTGSGPGTEANRIGARLAERLNEQGAQDLLPQSPLSGN